VRLRDLIRWPEGDPFLKVGVGAMFLAVGFATVVAVAAFFDRPIETAGAKPEVMKSATDPLVRSDPDVDPWVEKDIPPSRSQASSIPSSASASAAGSQPESVLGQDGPRDTGSGLQQGSGFGGPGQGGQGRGNRDLPVGSYDYPLPTDEQRRATTQTRRYDLPPGAIMSLTINRLGLNNVPVLSSASTRALDQGVIHLPQTSLPWSDTEERNVYLAGHRLGWPGTGSHLVFYQLDELSTGDRVTLRDRGGRIYRYRVIESFVVGPTDTWVTGRVRGRDLLTLQTCTPIPSFHKRLIVRAERI
jgi:sortase A